MISAAFTSWSVRRVISSRDGFSQPTTAMGDGVSIVDTSYIAVTNCTTNSNRDSDILISDGAHTTLTRDKEHGNGLGGVHTS